MFFGRMSFGGGRRKAQSQFEQEALPHMDALFSAAYYMTRNEKDAEDLVQETFLKAFRHFDKYEPGTNCKAWLFRILTNTFLNKNRRSVRELSFIDEVEVGDQADAVATRDASAHLLDPEASFVSRMMSSTVREALESVPPDFRMAVILADLQDFSYKEIAEVMDCPVGTVMSRIYRGRRLLQKKLLDYAIQSGVIAPPEAEGPAEEAQESEAPTSLLAYRARRAAGSRGA